MVEGFEWVTMDLTDEHEVSFIESRREIQDCNNISQLEEVYALLSGHYVEDDEAMFRFNYSVSFLNW